MWYTPQNLIFMDSYQVRVISWYIAVYPFESPIFNYYTMNYTLYNTHFIYNHYMLCPIFIHTATAISPSSIFHTEASTADKYLPHRLPLYTTMAHHPESDEEFNTLLTENADKLVIVDFFATWYVIC